METDKLRDPFLVLGGLKTRLTDNRNNNVTEEIATIVMGLSLPEALDKLETIYNNRHANSLSDESFGQIQEILRNSNIDL